MQARIQIQTKKKGLHDITAEIRKTIAEWPTETGILHVFIQHTSASLLIQENSDPTARMDLEEFLDRLVPEGQSWYRHLDEGPDDTVSHLKAAITATSLTIPVEDGRMLLGTWQGIYLWEHRDRPHTRSIVLTLLTTAP